MPDPQELSTPGTPGEIRYVKTPYGSTVAYRWASTGAIDYSTAPPTTVYDWKREDIYDQPRTPAGPSSVTIATGQARVGDIAHDNELADAKFKWEKDQADAKRRYDEEVLALKKLNDAWERAAKDRDFDQAAKIRAEEVQRRANLDKISEEQRKIDNDYKQKQIDLQAGGLTGYVNGQPTLPREQWEAELANQPGNYYNYMMRQAGLKANGPAPGLPKTSGEPASRPDYMNYSLEELEKFPDSYLSKLPAAILSQFRNEFLLSRPALMAILPPERVQGTGQYAGKGFSQEVIDKHGVGAPTPPYPKPEAVTGPTPTPTTAGGQPLPVTTQPAGSTLPIGGVGAPRAMPQTAPSTTSLQEQGWTQDQNTGAMMSPKPPVANTQSLPVQATPSVDEAIAAANNIVRQKALQGVA